MKQIIDLRWLFLGFLLLLSVVVNLSLGSVRIPVADLLAILGGKNVGNEMWSDIVWQFRVTKALTCLLAGSALAMAGLIMQTLFRNALAGPDVLGISSGASLAVSLVLMSPAALSGFVMATPWTVAMAATAGSVAVFVLVLAISRVLRDNTSLLIVGLMIGACVASIVSVLQFVSRAEDQQQYLIWTFGSLGGLNYAEIATLAVLLAVMMIFSASLVKPMNAWLLGNSYAQSLGVNIRSCRISMIIVACVLTGAVTAFCGPIAFVGLAVPHFARLIFRTHDVRVLLPASVICGAILLLVCDIIAQSPGSAYVLPINAVTALIGAPAVISIVLKARQLAM